MDEKYIENSNLSECYKIQEQNQNINMLKEITNRKNDIFNAIVLKDSNTSVRPESSKSSDYVILSLKQTNQNSNPTSHVMNTFIEII